MCHGEAREKLLHLDGTHRLRMPFVVENCPVQWNVMEG